MTPHQLIGVQVRRIAGQEVQRQLAVGAGHVLAHAGLLVRGQPIHNQMHRLAPPPHQLAQQFDEQLGIERARIGAVPEGARGRHRRGRADRLPLAGPRHHRGLAAYAPGLAVHRVGPKARFVPEQDLGTRALGLRSNPRVLLALPALDRLGVALIGALQRLLRRQPQPRQQITHRGETTDRSGQDLHAGARGQRLIH